MASGRLRLEVVGLLSEPPFHVAKCAAEDTDLSWSCDGDTGSILCRKTQLGYEEFHSVTASRDFESHEELIQKVLKRSFDGDFEDPVLKPLLQCAWHEYLCTMKKEIKGEAWEFSSHVMCFANGQLIGDEKALKMWANDTWGYKDYRPLPLYKALAEDFYTKYMRSTQHVLVYLDIAIQDKLIGRLLFELFSDICPKTCKNFQYLCSGEAGDSQSGLKLHYKGSPFHRIVKNGWIQGGDIASGKGNGGESIFRDTFEDENYAVPHNKRGILGMANKGRHSNGSQFYITLQATAYMDRKLVAFGQLIEGSEVLQKMEDIPTYNERPKVNCMIVDCGIFTP